MTRAPDFRPLEVVSVDELCSRRLLRSRPLLLSGLRAAPPHWNIPYIAQEIGDIEVPVVQVKDGEYRTADTLKISVREYLRQISRVAEPNTALPYLAELSYDRYFPGLARELLDPPSLCNEEFVSRVMYLGKTVNSQIHYHPNGSAILFCIAGKKLVRLYAPDQTGYLYRTPGTNFSEVLSSAGGDSPPQYDEERYPAFAKAKCVEVMVEPGNALMIPIYWWHGIQNFDEVSLTAVYFWRRLTPPGLKRFLPEHWPPAGMRSTFFRSNYRRLIEKFRSTRSSD